MESEVVRGKPLTKDETKFLVGLVENNKIILSKTTNATNNKMKTEEWIRITNQFNASTTICRRTPQQLRLKWENLKKNARKHSTKLRMNRIQTGGGVPEYIPPDDILDRVAAVLGSTASGFIVPFGGDKEPEVVEMISVDDGDVGGHEHIGGQAGVLPVDSGLSGEAVTIPLCIDDNAVIDVTEYELQCPSVANQTGTTTTPKRLALKTPRTGKKKLKTADDGRTSRNLALAEYYAAKKLCIDAKLQNILLQNEKLKLENEKLKLENEKLKVGLEHLKNK